MEPQPERSPIGRQIGRAAKIVRMWGDRCLAPLDATVTDWILLHYIDVDPGLSQTDLGRYADLSGPALVRHFDRLEGDGVLERRRDLDDRRVMRLSLTNRGRERLTELSEVMEACDTELRAVLTEEEQTVLERATGKLFEFALARIQQGAAAKEAS